MARLRNRSREPETSLRRRLVRRFRANRLDASAPPRNKRGIGAAGFDLRVAGHRVCVFPRSKRNLSDVLIERLTPVELAIVERERGEQFAICRLEIFEAVLRRAEAADGALIPEEPEGPEGPEDEGAAPIADGLKLRVRR